MKPVKIVLVFLSMLCSVTSFTQGTSCNSPFSLTLDAVSRNYAVSSSSGNSVHCSGSEFSGTGKITIFTFTTNATASCVLINIQTSGSQPAEVTLYTGCSGGGNCQGNISSCSVCFSDGEGYWAPAESYTMLANTTYYLRIWTPGSGTLTLAAKSYDPPNTTCAGATYLSTTPTPDNNACNKPSLEINPLDICAFSLENTAFYTYYVQNSGGSSIQINGINCDNSASGSSNGFQIGFFVGSCGALTKLNCVTNSGGAVSATTGYQPAGTQIFVVIDGTAGSNCSYTITAFNAMVLPVTVKYLTAWKKTEANLLTWETTSETEFSHFEIEKSHDGEHFSQVGKVNGHGNSQRNISYSFEDKNIRQIQYYRLKYVNFDGHYTYSNVVKVLRDDISNAKVIFQNNVTDQLSLRILDLDENKLNIRIADNSGRLIQSRSVNINRGENSFTIPTGSMQKGFYYLILSGENYHKTLPFLKS